MNEVTDSDENVVFVCEKSSSKHREITIDQVKRLALQRDVDEQSQPTQTARRLKSQTFVAAEKRVEKEMEEDKSEENRVKKEKHKKKHATQPENKNCKEQVEEKKEKRHKENKRVSEEDKCWDGREEKEEKKKMKKNKNIDCDSFNGVNNRDVVDGEDKTASKKKKKKLLDNHVCQDENGQSSLKEENVAKKKKGQNKSVQTKPENILKKEEEEDDQTGKDKTAKKDKKRKADVGVGGTEQVEETVKKEKKKKKERLPVLNKVTGTETKKKTKTETIKKTKRTENGIKSEAPETEEDTVKLKKKKKKEEERLPVLNKVTGPETKKKTKTETIKKTKRTENGIKSEAPETEEDTVKLKKKKKKEEEEERLPVLNKVTGTETKKKTKTETIKKTKRTENGIKPEAPETKEDAVKLKKKKKEAKKKENATENECEKPTEVEDGKILKKKKGKSVEIAVAEEGKTKKRKKERCRTASVEDADVEVTEPKKKKKKTKTDEETVLVKCEDIEEQRNPAVDAEEKKSKKKKISVKVEQVNDAGAEAGVKKKKRMTEGQTDSQDSSQVEVVFLSHKSGNVDEVTIDQERRQALQMEIDEASEPEKPAKPTGLGQWSTAQFNSAEQQQKFLRLMGGFKKGVQPTAAATGGANMALGKEAQQQLQKGLLGEFERAHSRRMDFSNKGAGLGFTAPSNKKFSIDVNACRSVRFDD